MKQFEHLTTDELAEALHFASEELWAGRAPTGVEAKLETDFELNAPAANRIVRLAQRLLELSVGRGDLTKSTPVGYGRLRMDKRRRGGL